MVTKENHKCHFSSKIVSDKLCKFQSYKTCDSIQGKSQNPPRSWDSSSGNGYCQNVLTSSNFQAKYFSLYKEQANMLVWQKTKQNNSYTTLLRVLFLVFYFNFHSYSWISKSGQKLKCTGCFLPDSPVTQHSVSNKGIGLSRHQLKQRLLEQSARTDKQKCIFEFMSSLDASHLSCLSSREDMIMKDEHSSEWLPLPAYHTMPNNGNSAQ